jgi:hydroxymethylpyrimidine pyrophosphatase-like HAD family hydrolase
MHSPQENFGLPTAGNVRWETALPQDLPPSIGAMILTDEEAVAAEVLRRLRPLDLTLIEFHHFGNYLIGIHPAGSTKGDALLRLASHLRLSTEEILAIGDSNNDVEMLQNAGIGIAVAGSTERAIAAADYVCTGGAVLGVIEILEQLSVANR